MKFLKALEREILPKPSQFTRPYLFSLCTASPISFSMFLLAHSAPDTLSSLVLFKLHRSCLLFYSTHPSFLGYCPCTFLNGSYIMFFHSSQIPPSP